MTADGVEVLTARLPDSPGGPIPIPIAEATNGTNGINGADGATNGDTK